MTTNPYLDPTTDARDRFPRGAALQPGPDPRDVQYSWARGSAVFIPGPWFVVGFKAEN